MFAAAGVIALDEMRCRLHTDNRRAAELAMQLECVPGLSIRKPRISTNIVLLDGPVAQRLADHLSCRGILTLKRFDGCIRLVTHRLIDEDTIRRFSTAIQEFVQ
jgi:threonine aldolase